jgi:hypothetical protein
MEKLLIGKTEISAFLRNASDHKLRVWINRGMPVLIDGEWLAHADNLEQWFRSYTRRRSTMQYEE